MPRHSTTAVGCTRGDRSFQARRSLTRRFAVAFTALATMLAITAHYAHYEASGKGLTWHLS